MKIGAGKKSNKMAADIAVIVVLLLFVIASFYFFVKDNSKRVLEQTDNFVEASTTQVADRLNDMIYTAHQSVNLLSLLYSSGDDPTVDTAMLQDMTDRSAFDYVEFIDANGQDLTADGRTADLSDRAHFRDGMAGNSGKTVIRNSRITNETLLVFYAPAYYDDEITGVFTGMIRASTLSDRLSMDYFGLQGNTYLLERSGDVILSTDRQMTSGNLPQVLRRAAGSPMPT